MHGGGVIGLLSLSPKPHMRALTGSWAISRLAKNGLVSRPKDEGAAASYQYFLLPTMLLVGGGDGASSVADPGRVEGTVVAGAGDGIG